MTISGAQRGRSLLPVLGLVVVLTACGSSAGSVQGEPGDTGRPPSGGSTSGPAGGDSQGQNAPSGPFATPTPGGRTPVDRYAWCLREAGLPAVVIGSDVAFEGTGSSSTEQGPLTRQTEIEADCQARHPDYTPPNFNQR